MKLLTQLKVVVTAALLVLSVGAIDQGCSLTNEPSDSATIAGVLIVVATLCVLPSVLLRLWRRSA